MYGRSELIFYFILIFWTVYCIYFFQFFSINCITFFFRFLNKMFNPGKVRNILGVILIFDQDKLLNGEIHLPSQAE